jgi:hypothetical protein
MILNLKANEVRTATTPQGDTVKVQYVAGGMFTNVSVRDAAGNLVWTRNYQYTDNAVRKYADIAAGNYTRSDR